MAIDNKAVLLLALVGAGAGAYMLLNKDKDTTAALAPPLPVEDVPYLDWTDADLTDTEKQTALINACAEVDIDIEGLRDTANKLKNDVSRLKVLIAEQEAAIAILLGHIATMESSLGRQADAILAMEDAIRAIELALSGLEQEKQALLDEIGIDFPQLEAITNFIADIRAEITSLQDQIVALEHERDLLEQELQLINEQINALNEQKLDMQETIADFEAQIEMAEAQIIALEEQLELVPIKTTVRGVHGNPRYRKVVSPFISAGIDEVRASIHLLDKSWAGDPTIRIYRIKGNQEIEVAKWSLRVLRGNGFNKSYDSEKSMTLELGVYKLEAYRPSGSGGERDAYWECEASITTLCPRFLVALLQ